VYVSRESQPDTVASRHMYIYRERVCVCIYLEREALKRGRGSERSRLLHRLPVKYSFLLECSSLDAATDSTRISLRVVVGWLPVLALGFSRAD
jgi:hypothetical protein